VELDDVELVRAHAGLLVRLLRRGLRHRKAHAGDHAAVLEAAAAVGGEALARDDDAA
jgi:hypothetical protein